MSCRNVSTGSQMRGVSSRRDGSWLPLRGKWEGTAGLCPQMKGFLAERSSWSINTLQRPALLPAWVCSVLKREQLTPPLFTDKAVVERALNSQKSLSPKASEVESHSRRTLNQKAQETEAGFWDRDQAAASPGQHTQSRARQSRTSSATSSCAHDAGILGVLWVNICSWSAPGGMNPSL